jgi:hypothetical protein
VAVCLCTLKYRKGIPLEPIFGEVFPLWIDRPDKILFVGSGVSFDLFFTIEGSHDIPAAFKVDQFVDLVLSSNSTWLAFSMFCDSSN